MKYMNMGFVDAIEWLSDQYNIDLSSYVEYGGESKYDLKLLYEIMREAGLFFFNAMKSNKVSQNYLRNRGLSLNTITEFGIGYSHDSWSSLYDFLTRKGFKDTDILTCGLIKKKSQDGFYDTFRNRIMFPIFGYYRVCAFGARVLDNSNPKYLNSAQSVIFDKSKTLYGFNFVNKITEAMIC